MWLPGSIYERIPQIMLVLGLIFMLSAAYIGFAHPLTKLYFGTGVICFLWSLWVMTVRLRHRQPQGSEKNAAGPESSEAEKDAAAESGR